MLILKKIMYITYFFGFCTFKYAGLGANLTKRFGLNVQ